MKNALNNSLVKLCLVLSVIGPLKISRATEAIPKNPTEVLAEACDAALNDQITLNEQQRSLIEQLKIASAVRQERILQLEGQAGAWYNRTELMLVMGLAAGLIAGGLIAK
jgi:hypothetical protein